MSKLSQELGITHPTLSTYLDMLKDSKIFHPIKKYSTRVSRKPAKLLFDNTNILYAYSDEFGVEASAGTVRETFFASCFPDIYYSDVGDFRVKDTVFEIGGKNKTAQQIKDVKNAYLVIDIDYTTDTHKIPLWLFGMM
ncbi:MAG: ATP-binding protein [Desulfobacterales bacterium]|nr:ATP-binding protein [Desulfobacterales bacterium]